MNLTDQLVTVPSAFVQLGAARLNLTGQFQHPRDSFTTGPTAAPIFKAIRSIWRRSTNCRNNGRTPPASSSSTRMSPAIYRESFNSPAVNGNAAVHGLQLQGQNYGDLTATATTSGQIGELQPHFKLRGFEHSHRRQHAAHARLSNHGSRQLRQSAGSAAAGRGESHRYPGERTALGNSRTSVGPSANPQGSADLTLANGSIYDNAVDRVHHDSASIDATLAGKSRNSAARSPTTDRPASTDLKSTCPTNAARAQPERRATERRRRRRRSVPASRASWFGT